jgi:oligopeptide/dipeptide ABC transporter ATP-binding protein
MLVKATSGEIRFSGENLAALPSAALRRARRDLQIIFQDPYGSLNPRLRVADLLLEGLRIQGLAERSREPALVEEMLARVGLNAAMAQRYPHELSGGQRQRIGIARTLALRPKLIVADEPVSALDVSVQAQILNLLIDLKRDLGLTYVFIAHNLAVVAYIADRIAVMYLGRIVEIGRSEALQRRPLHPYTVALIAATPQMRAEGYDMRLPGEPPSPLAIPKGCRFRGRCPAERPICAAEEPKLVENAPDHLVACHFPGTATPASGFAPVRDTGELWKSSAPNLPERSISR